MITLEAAERLAQAWLDSWNAHDLDSIMEHYAENVEFWSPLIAKRLGLAEGKLVGKDALRSYFAGGLAANPNLYFTLIRVLPGMDSTTVYYRRQDNSETAEVTALDADGRAIWVRVHYSGDSSVWKA